MLVDKPPWCSHDGHPIFSIHAQPAGSRFATGGSDGLAKVWSLPCVLDTGTEIAPGAQPLLANLSEHNGPVNVVRFSPDGRYLATGSDDHIACVFERRPGPGMGSLGSARAGVENWRLVAALRGHTNNVVDLAWSPDSRLLVTASLDGTAAVWEAGTGTRVARLASHSSFVKGVAWDPVGSYLATQAEDRTLALWRVGDWACLARVTAPFQMMISSTFALRCSWSPDGQWLLAGNSYQGATHAAVLIPRERWDQAAEYLYVSGHTGAIVCGAFNPRLFQSSVAACAVPRPATPPPGKENGDIDHGDDKGAPAVDTGDTQTAVRVGDAGTVAGEAATGQGASGGVASMASPSVGRAAQGLATVTAPGAEDAQELYSVFAIGSQDRKATVWASCTDRPLFCASHFFSAQVLDVAWAPSGYALLASSSDGTVAVFQFSEAELGTASSADTVQTLLRGLYGRVGTDKGRRLAESVEQLELEEAAGTPGPGKLSGKPAEANGKTAASGSSATPPSNLPGAAAPRPSQAPAPTGLAALDARLGGAAAAMGFSPAKHPRSGKSAATQAQDTRDAGPATPGAIPAGETPGPAHRAAPLGGPAVPAQALLPPAPVHRELVVPLPARPAGAFAVQESDAGERWQLRIVNRAGRPGSATAWCQPVAPSSHGAAAAGPGLGSAGTGAVAAEYRWEDMLSRRVALAAASPSGGWVAVALEDGSLLVYTARGGRRALGPLKLGAGLARLAASRHALLALTVQGDVHVWRLDPRTGACLKAPPRASIWPLLSDGGSGGGASVPSAARLASLALTEDSCAPLATLADGRAYVYAHTLAAWTCIADDTTALSAHRPSPLPRDAGELERAQAGTLARVEPRAGAAARALLRGGGGAAAAAATRAHLEASLSAGRALGGGSGTEYRAWLGRYAGFLAAAGDCQRLAELCDELAAAGVAWQHKAHAVATGGRSTGMDLDDDHHDEQHWWDQSPLSEHAPPAIAGVELLRDVVLPVIGRHRELQDLAARVRGAVQDMQEGWTT